MQTLETKSVDLYFMKEVMMAKDWGVYMKPETAVNIIKDSKKSEGDRMTVLTESDIYPLLENAVAQQEFDYLMML